MSVVIAGTRCGDGEGAVEPGHPRSLTRAAVRLCRRNGMFLAYNAKVERQVRFVVCVFNALWSFRFNKDRRAEED